MNMNSNSNDIGVVNMHKNEDFLSSKYILVQLNLATWNLSLTAQQLILGVKAVTVQSYVSKYPRATYRNHKSANSRSV